MEYVLLLFILLLSIRYWYVALPLLIMLIIFVLHKKKDNKNFTIESDKEGQQQIDINKSSEPVISKKQEDIKENKPKEFLTLQHSLTEKDINYQFPPINFLKQSVFSDSEDNKKTVTETVNNLQKTLYNFGVSVKIESVSVGPITTRYELKLAERSKDKSNNQISR